MPRERYTRPPKPPRDRENQELVEMQQKLARDLLLTAAPAALERLKQLVGSSDERVAVAAAKTILDKTIATPQAKAPDLEDAVDLERMSQAQLAETIKRLEDELGGRARDITPAPYKYEFLN